MEILSLSDAHWSHLRIYLYGMACTAIGFGMGMLLGWYVWGGS